MSSEPEFIHSDPAIELASNRTAMSFERTALASDRTLMAVVRTALSLIGFGFTVFQFFHLLNNSVLKTPAPYAPRTFSLALILLGVALLTLGIFNHLRETRGRRARRQTLCDKGLIRHPEIVKTSSALLVAISLWLVGVVAVVDVVSHFHMIGQGAR